MYEFEIEITKENFLNSLIYKIKRIKKNIKKNQTTDVYSLIIISFVMLIGYFFYRLIKEETANIDNIIVIIFSILVLVAFYFVWQRYSYLKFLENNVSNEGVVLGKWVINVTDKVIAKTKTSCSIEYQWQCVKSIEKDRDYIYVFVDEMVALVFPLSQIPDGLESYLYQRFDEIKSG